MAGIKLKAADLNDFIQSRDKVNSFATICGKENAHFCFAENNFYFGFKSYEDEYYNDILNQAKNWEIKIIRTEDWDPSIYDIGRIVKEGIQDINPKNILVENGIFVGVIDYADHGEHYELSYALLKDYTGEPILFRTTSGFGSSDHDMMYTVNFYLQKKD